MPTFIYEPGVKVYISTAKHGVIDISDDLTEGTMVRRSDGVSTFNFSVNNPRRKYDSVFTPNDRIIVSMKRLAWVRTFTGLLNSVPLLSAWPRNVSMSASCSLKRLQYWFWDSHAAATQQMIINALAASGLDKTQTDGGITNVTLNILEKVVGWPASKVHIARIPDDWFKIAEKVAEQVDAGAQAADALAQQFYSTLGGGGLVGGTTSGVMVAGQLPPGKYANATLDADQCRIAETIYSVALSMGGSGRDAVIGIITGMQESTLTNLDHGDRDSIGVFQQRKQGWGSPADRMNPKTAATNFFKKLLNIPNRDRMQEGQAAQAVQVSAYPDAYQKWVPMASQIVGTLGGGVGLAGDARWRSTVAAGGLTSNTANGGGAQGVSTGQAFAKAGVDFVSKYPRVMYEYGSPRSPGYLAQEPPRALDCSAFTSAIFLRTVGSADLPAQTDAQVAYCMNHGGIRLTADEALRTPGALVFAGNYPGTTHVEISLGTGTQTVGTRHRGTPASVKDWGSYHEFSFGCTVPGMNYPGGLGGTNGIDVSALGNSTALQGTGADPTVASQLPGYNPHDPFDRLFGSAPWSPNPVDDASLQLSEGLTGIRALLNDQPLLPYLKNLFNSTMRSFSSAPNGDLIAWFPDYYGLWGTAAKMVLEPIEVQDFTVDWADDFFVTHQFTIAGQLTYLDVGSGTAQTDFSTASGADIRTETLGIASVDIPAVMYALFGIDASAQEAKNFAAYIYKRFGARPDYQEMPGLQGPKAEFFSALFMFMRQWAYQYNADVPLTFMPELWPGMLLQMPFFDFQAYVTTVTHTFRFGQGGGFQTTVNIAAPARLPKKKGDRDNVLIGLPLAGDYKPGRGVGNIDDSLANPISAADAYLARQNDRARRNEFMANR